MAPKRSIFFEDWRACLHAHYEYVIRAGDTITEPTLRQVLQQTGLSDDELDAIRAEILSSASLEHATASGEVEQADSFLGDLPTPSAEPLPEETFDDVPTPDTAPYEDPQADAGELPPDDSPPRDPTPPRPSQLSLF